MKKQTEQTIQEFPVLLKDLKVELESAERLTDEDIKILIHKHIKKLNFIIQTPSYEFQDIISKALDKAIPTIGEFPSTPLWKSEVSTILEALTAESVILEPFHQSKICRIHPKVIELLKYKAETHLKNIRATLESELAKNGIPLSFPPIGKLDLAVAVELENNQDYGHGNVFLAFFHGLKAPIYGIFSISMLCWILFGTPLLTSAIAFFKAHPTYVLLALILLGFSGYQSIAMWQKNKQLQLLKLISQRLPLLSKNCSDKLSKYFANVPSQQSIYHDYMAEVSDAILKLEEILTPQTDLAI